MSLDLLADPAATTERGCDLTETASAIFSPDRVYRYALTRTWDDLPPAVFLGGLALLIYTLPKWRQRARRTAPLAAAKPLKPDEAERLDDDLANFI